MFTILCWNLLAASLAKTRENFEQFSKRFIDIESFINTILYKNNPFDILCFAEVDEQYMDARMEFLLPQLLDKTFSFDFWLPIYISKPKPVADGYPKHGNLILLRKDTVKLHGVFPLIFSTDDDAQMNQIAQVLFLEVNKKKVILCFVHLKSGFGPNEATRLAQIQEIKKTLESYEFFSNKVLLVGDFNTSMASKETLLTSVGYFDVYKKYCAPEIPVPCLHTQATPKIKSAHAKDHDVSLNRLDYIFAKNIEAKGIITFYQDHIEKFNKQNLSDHFPIGAVVN